MLKINGGGSLSTDLIPLALSRILLFLRALCSLRNILRTLGMLLSVLVGIGLVILQ